MGQFFWFKIPRYVALLWQQQQNQQGVKNAAYDLVHNRRFVAKMRRNMVKIEPQTWNIVNKSRLKFRIFVIYSIMAIFFINPALILTHYFLNESALKMPYKKPYKLPCDKAIKQKKAAKFCVYKKIAYQFLQRNWPYSRLKSVRGQPYYFGKNKKEFCGFYKWGFNQKFSMCYSVITKVQICFKNFQRCCCCGIDFVTPDLVLAYDLVSNRRFGP